MRKFCLTITAALVLAVSSPAADKPAKSDDHIVDSVRLKLVNDPDVKGGALQVEAKDGVVTITGRVATQKARDKAERLAKKVKGVSKVENQITVAPL